MHTKLFFKTFGSSDAPPLVILHGWGISSTEFEKLGGLLGKHFHVFIPDLPGFGQSAEPSKPWSITDYSKAVMSFMSEQNVRSATLVGHSFGGQIAIVIASSHPDRVRNLVLTGASGVESLNLKRSAKRLIYFLAAKVLKWFTWIPPVQRLKNRFYLHRDYIKVTGVMLETFRQVISEHQNKACQNVKAPASLLWGQTDRLTPVHDADLINRLIPRAKLKIFANVGHKLPYQKPHEFAHEVVTFCLRGGNESGMG